MSTLLPVITPESDFTSAVAVALSRIPPLWPLRHFVAVNPFVGLTDLSFVDACALLQRTTGAAPLQSPADYLAAYRDGAISPEDLAAAADGVWTAEGLLEAVGRAETPGTEGPLATVADLLDQQSPRAHWGVFVTEEISKWCAVVFDGNQGTWRSPWRPLGLYASWRESAAFDRNPEAFGLPGFRAFVRTLPVDAEACIDFCLRRLAPRSVDLSEFLQRQLATIAGWAGYVQYRVREDALRGRSNTALQELLAVRLAYDAALFQAFARDGVFRADWRHQLAPAHDPALLSALVRWQLAYERGYQRRLARMIARQSPVRAAVRPSAQAVFCIDVRSEVLRRHLESALPTVQTIGFAGFFGFPVAHRRLGDDADAARCPVLLVPPVETGEGSSAEELAERTRRAEAGAWKAFQNSAVSCFSFVESAGLAFGAALAGRPRASRPTCAAGKPRFASGDAASLETRTAMAEGALRNMSLTKNFARLVLICGHGSVSANNPYASALDCGACGGHAGDVNARLAAAALNDPAVREHLSKRGILLPDDTVFLAGLHITTTDDVCLFDLEVIPASHAGDLAALQSALAVAGAGVRTERAPSLGLSPQSSAQLERTVRERGADASQVRPEWGLANNAALIAAPRSRTAGLKLDGRVFLHDYDAAADTDLKVLTLILCAPVVVASWINLQYYASRVDPTRYGSGNKVLHNVVGGLGVVEGNAGDLRVGLPLQSIHDGEKFVHEPRRLTVVIDATRRSIDTVLAAQAAVRILFDHQWIHLVSLEGGQAYLSTSEGWQPL